MSGKAPRQKGNRLERELVNYFKSVGLLAHRVPYSGSMVGYKGDVQLTVKGTKFVLEAKSRQSGFKFLYDSLGDNNLLCIKRDRDKPLIIMDIENFIRIIRCYNPHNPQVTNDAA